jgi:hypothetical protein
MARSREPKLKSGKFIGLPPEKCFVTEGYPLAGSDRRVRPAAAAMRPDDNPLIVTNTFRLRA